MNVSVKPSSTSHLWLIIYVLLTTPLTLLISLFALGKWAQIDLVLILLGTIGVLSLIMTKCRSRLQQMVAMVAAFGIWYLLIDVIGSHFGWAMC